MGPMPAFFGEADAFSAMAGFASQGTLQVFSMACRAALRQAYEAAGGAWTCLDMAEWPFVQHEARRLRLGAKAAAVATLGQNTRTTDLDLLAAVGRIPRGRLRSLRLCSSRVTDGGVAAALTMHRLERLHLDSCGSGLLTAAAVLPASCSLRCLELDGMPGVVAQLAGHLGRLEELVLRGASEDDVKAVAGLSGLSALRVESLDTRVKLNRNGLPVPAAMLPGGPFLEVLRRCRKLERIHIGCVLLTDAALQHVQEFVPRLKSFYGTGSADTLSLATLDALRRRFPDADIFIERSVF